MAGFSNTVDGALLDEIFGGQNYIPPITLYFALLTTAPTDLKAGTGGVEASYTGYARVAVTNNLTNFPVASGSPRAKTNATDIVFALPSATGGTIVALGVYDSAAAGTYLAGSALTAPKSIASGDPIKLPAGSLALTQGG